VAVFAAAWSPEVKRKLTSSEVEWVELMSYVAKRDRDLYAEILADLHEYVGRKRLRSK
jgi:hypothetical protein